MTLWARSQLPDSRQRPPPTPPPAQHSARAALRCGSQFAQLQIGDSLMVYWDAVHSRGLGQSPVWDPEGEGRGQDLEKPEAGPPGGRRYPGGGGGGRGKAREAQANLLCGPYVPSRGAPKPRLLWRGSWAKWAGLPEGRGGGGWGRWGALAWGSPRRARTRGGQFISEMGHVSPAGLGAPDNNHPAPPPSSAQAPGAKGRGRGRGPGSRN